MNDRRIDASKTVYCSKEADNILDWLSVHVISLRVNTELRKRRYILLYKQEREANLSSCQFCYYEENIRDNHELLTKESKKKNKQNKSLKLLYNYSEEKMDFKMCKPLRKQHSLFSYTFSVSHK